MVMTRVARVEMRFTRSGPPSWMQCRRSTHRLGGTRSTNVHATEAHVGVMITRPLELLHSVTKANSETA
jgi:hypothetical protein